MVRRRARGGGRPPGVCAAADGTWRRRSRLRGRANSRHPVPACYLSAAAAHRPRSIALAADKGALPDPWLSSLFIVGAVVSRPALARPPLNRLRARGLGQCAGAGRHAKGPISGGCLSLSAARYGPSQPHPQLLRGAGCTVNDLWDRDIDRQVRGQAGMVRRRKWATSSTGACTAKAEAPLTLEASCRRSRTSPRARAPARPRSSARAPARSRAARSACPPPSPSSARSCPWASPSCCS
jgi:hypothetical protein